MKTDLKKYRNILKQEGTARVERYPADLDPANLVIDDRSLADLLLYAQRYNKNVRFVPAEGFNFSQSWESFFNKDVIFVLTNISSKNAQQMRGTFDKLYQQFDENREAEQFIDMADYIFSRFERINKWYGLSSLHELLRNDLKIFIEAYLSRKAQDFHALIMHTRWTNEKGKALQEKLNIFREDEVWGTAKDYEDAEADFFIDGDDETAKLVSASIRMNDIFDTLFYVTDGVITNANTYFGQILEGRRDHPPHIALLVAFLKVFSYVQQDFNRLPQRHLEYYYEDVLGIRKRKAVPDQAYVLFEMAKGFDTVKLDKGTPLSAGKDKKNVDQRYELDKDIVVSKAQVSTIKTILVKKNAHKQVEGYFTNDIVKDDSGALSPSPWGTFGDSAGSIAHIGFAIASPQLRLSQGERTVTINFELAENITEQEFDISLVKIMLTGEKGWLQSNVQADAIAINTIRATAPNILTVGCTIALAQQSAIVDFSTKLHGNHFTAGAPVIQCLLQYPVAAETENDEYYNSLIQQLDVLQKLQIVNATIKVEVGSMATGVSFDGVRNLVLENHDAVLNSAKPFYPFTGTPRVGSSFYISCDELLHKPLKKMAVNIEWMLPPKFKIHYDNYFAPYNSNKFRASVTMLHDSVWKSLKETSIIDTDSLDPRFRSIKIDFDNLKDAGVDNDISKADFSKIDGTLKLKLEYPDFGHSVYPQLMTASVMSKSGAKNSHENYSKIIKKQLHESVYIELPNDIDQKGGSLKAMYDILEKITDDNRAKAMLEKLLADKIRQYNGSNVVIKKQAGVADDEVIVDSSTTMMVKDDNLVERIFKFLGRLKVVDKDTHFDQDRQSVESVVQAVNKDLVTSANFILPTDRELTMLIMDETNVAINKTVSKVVAEMLEIRKTGEVDAAKISEAIKKDFEQSNEVINDIIAEKIAAMLLANEVPSPPYTPLANSLSLNYVSEKNCEEGIDKFFQVTPFGVVEINPFASNDYTADNTQPIVSNYLFAQNGFCARPMPYSIAGIFFIGITNVVPYQQIAFLFQFAEGTRASEKRPPGISWHYVAGNKLVPFKDEYIVSDSTHGFQTTGIVEISIPDNLNADNTLLSAPQTSWIAAVVQDEPTAFPLLLNVAANAATATFADEGNDPAHYALPLPAMKISKLVDAVAAIKKVVQPLASYNGAVQEEGKEYYARVSERLRHKSRAINNWDYERLVLSNFPAVFKVKCLNNYYNGKFAVGHVTIVPVCDLRNNDYSNINLLYPKASYVLLSSIRQLLSSKAPPFVKVHVINPKLDHILISCKVKFKKGVDKGYFLKQLNEEVMQFLTPWANKDIKTLSFSSKVYASSVMNFIDKRPYVDYVTEMVMNQYVETDTGEREFHTLPNGSISLVETEFTTAHSILVSAPAHNIELIE